MEIEYGAEVIDKNGKSLGTVNKVIRDSWTGEISKFQVSTEHIEADLFISPEDVAEVTANEVKLKVAFD
ncbi:MAG TPA: PRC-barrel domain-containing protein [Dehalococcoidales bacterium]|nr:PRC-barrel domain-containing protein [Dehalococcoidales bacterium]